MLIRRASKLLSSSRWSALHRRSHGKRDPTWCERKHNSKTRELTSREYERKICREGDELRPTEDDRPVARDRLRLLDGDVGELCVKKEQWHTLQTQAYLASIIPSHDINEPHEGSRDVADRDALL